VTGGMLTQLPKFNPNRLFDLLGHPRSLITPARAPIPTPEPPYPPFDPLTPEGRRRSAERMISSPAREKELAEERAYLAAIRAVELEFDETRNDQFALRLTILRKNLNLPVRDIRAKLEGIEEEEMKMLEEKTEDEADDEKEDEEGDESDDGSLGDEEFNVSFLRSKRMICGWDADERYRQSIIRLRLYRVFRGRRRVLITALDWFGLRNIILHGSTKQQEKEKKKKKRKKTITVVTEHISYWRKGHTFTSLRT
jgi:hypothetical protein